MKNKQEKSVVVLAGAEMFDYLKEKVGERKTRTEAYSDLLDKSLAGFVSPFLKKQEYELQPYQCHVTISDLATEWHWHRATVRSFLETLETFGQLKRTKLVKSIVITMNVQSDRHPETTVVQQEHDFAMQLQEALSDWVVGKTTSDEAGKICGQVVRQAIAGIAESDSRHYPDSHIDTVSVHAGKQEKDIRNIALGCVAQAALQRVLRKSRFDDGSPLIEFFRHELGGEWAAFIETSKELAGLILDTGTDGTAIDKDEDTECLKSLRKPFLSLLSRACEAAD